MGATDGTCKILVGNKCDAEAERQVSTEEGKKKAAELGVKFVETSAKINTAVGEAFELVSKELITLREASGASSKQQGGGLNLLRPDAAAHVGSLGFHLCVDFCTNGSQEELSSL